MEHQTETTLFDRFQTLVLGAGAYAAFGIVLFVLIFFRGCFSSDERPSSIARTEKVRPIIEAQAAAMESAKLGEASTLDQLASSLAGRDPKPSKIALPGSASASAQAAPAPAPPTAAETVESAPKDVAPVPVVEEKTQAAPTPKEANPKPASTKKVEAKVEETPAPKVIEADVAPEQKAEAVPEAKPQIVEAQPQPKAETKIAKPLKPVVEEDMPEPKLAEPKPAEKTAPVTLEVESKVEAKVEAATPTAPIQEKAKPAPAEAELEVNSAEPISPAPVTVEPVTETNKVAVAAAGAAAVAAGAVAIANDHENESATLAAEDTQTLPVDSPEAVDNGEASAEAATVQELAPAEKTSAPWWLYLLLFLLLAAIAMMFYLDRLGMFPAASGSAVTDSDAPETDAQAPEITVENRDDSDTEIKEEKK